MKNGDQLIVYKLKKLKLVFMKTSLVSQIYSTPMDTVGNVKMSKFVHRVEEKLGDSDLEHELDVEGSEALVVTV